MENEHKCDVCGSFINVERRNPEWKGIVTNDELEYICKECLRLTKIFIEIDKELNG